MRDYFDFKKLKLVSVLTYAGSLPFIIAAILMYWDLERFSLFGDVEKIINSYGLIIVVFIAGSHWGLSFQLSRNHQIFLKILSNFLTLLIFAAYVWLTNIPFQIWLILTLFILLGLDYWLYFKGINSQEYVLMRLIVSIIVIISLYGVFSS